MRWSRGVVPVIGLLVAWAPATAVQAGTLAISSDGRFFTIDGTPTYLNGISYYANQTISTASFRTQDLDDMVARKFNWLRVWTTWTNSVTGENTTVIKPQDGSVREPYMTRLKTLIIEANNRGMIVDVTSGRDSSRDPSSSIIPANQAQHLVWMQTLANQLLTYRNVYFDMANERDVGDSRYVSIPEVGALIDAVKAIDPNRVCTASGTPGSQADMSVFKVQGHLDFIATHLCRDQGCAAQTVGTVKQFIGWMTNLGFRMPVHLQEPFRRSYAAYNPAEDDYYEDDSGAKIAEAAGWCLHNGSNNDQPPFRSFLMDDPRGRLFAQLDSVEIKVANAINDRIGGTAANVRKYQAEYSEQLSHQIGRREGAGWSANPAQDAAGFLVYGPYLNTVPAGTHKIEWNLRIDNNDLDNNVVAVLDVLSGGTTLLSRTVNRPDFAAANSNQTFSSHFTSTGQQNLEFRVHWLDSAYILCDWVQLTINVGQQPAPPVIAAVTPNPQFVYPNVVYIKQLTLAQGQPLSTWLLLEAPSGASVNVDGLISGWTPGPADWGDHTFTAQATNSQGSDSKTWIVRVISRSDFDRDGDVDQSDFGHWQGCVSGTGLPYPAGCVNADFNQDGSVDQNDFGLFAPCFGGSGQPPGC